MIGIRARLLAGATAGGLGALLLVAPGAPAVPAASSDTVPAAEIGGFRLQARSHAVKVLFDTPGALPVGPLVELTAPESRVTLGSGPSGTALSSLGHPGPVIAGAEQIAAAGGYELPADVPDYPVQASASTSGPTEVRDTTTVPGASMVALADGPHVEARTEAPGLGLPGVVELTSLASEATGDSGDVVTGSGSTRVGPISLLGGLIEIDAVRSTASATSNGTVADGAAATEVLGASLLGQPIVVDPDGIAFAGTDSGTGALLQGALAPLGGPDGLLAAAGLSLRVGSIRDEAAGAAAVAGTEGLLLTFAGAVDLSSLDPVLELAFLVPPVEGLPLQLADAVAVLQAEQVREIAIGQVLVDVTASPPASFPAPTLAAPGTPAGPAPASSGPAGSAGTSAHPTVAAPAGGGDGDPTPLAPAPVGAGGTLPSAPAGYALVVLGGGLLLSAGTRRLPDLALATGARPGADCLRPPAAEESP